MLRHSTLYDLYANLPKPSGHYMYLQVLTQKFLRSAHTLYLRILYGSENKRRLFPYTALTDCFL
jgi:hypothetical protein